MAAPWVPGCGRACCGRPAVGPGRAKQVHVVRIDHGCIGGVAVCRPHGAAIKALQRAVARRHVGKATQPDELVGPVQVAELAQHAHALRLLGFHKFPVEQVDEHLALLGVQGVLAQFNDGVGICGGHGGS